MVRNGHYPSSHSHRAALRRALQPSFRRLRHTVGPQASAACRALVNRRYSILPRTIETGAPRRMSCKRRWLWLAMLTPALLAACAEGDFGRIKPEYVVDDTHSWLGTEAVYRFGGPFSVLPLTDDEKTLRDLAFPLIEPPYDRQRWYSIVNEYGVRRFVQPEWLVFVQDAYERHLMATPFRSANARYAKLNEDVRNDVVRMGPFFTVARRVVDMDAKRGQSLSYIHSLAPREQLNAVARNAENALIIAWVQCSLAQRATSYRYALEHLVISTPAPVAVDVERSLALMQTTIANKHILDEPNVCAGAPITLAQDAFTLGAPAAPPPVTPAIVSK
jgi:hypothetical protein